MTKLFKFLVILVIVFLLLLIPAYYFFNAKVKDQIIPKAKSFIQEQTDLDIDFKVFRLSVSKLFKLEPSIKIEELRIEEAVKIKQIYIELSLKDLLQRKFSIKEILIDGAEIVLEENINREVTLKGFKAPSAASSADSGTGDTAKAPGVNNLLESLSLDSLRIINSKIEFNAYKALEPFVLKPVEAELKDLQISDSKTIRAKYNFNAQILDSKRSSIKAKGELGPIDFSLKRIPITGNEKLSFYLSDINARERQKLLGDLVIVKNDTAVFQESNFKGDLMKELSGSGTLKTKNLVIGNSDDHQLAVETEFPHSYKLGLAKLPKLKFETKNARVDLRTKDRQSGHLIFNAYVQQELDTGLVQGSSNGRLEGLELQEVLNSVAEHRDVISGLFEITNYQIYFKGRDAEQISKSLKGDGSIAVHNGSLYILKSITKYQDFASNFIENTEAIVDKVSGEFVSLTTDFKISKGDLYTDPFELKTTSVNIAGAGVIKQAKDLSYDLVLDVPRVRSIPIKIRGTLEKPRVYPDAKQLGKEQGQKLINDALKFGLDALIRNAKPPVETTSP